MDSYDAKRDRGFMSFDRRHNLIVSYVYALPFGLSGAGWYKKAFGGWQLSGITTLNTGLPLNLGITGDRAGTGLGNQRQVGCLLAEEFPCDGWVTILTFNCLILRPVIIPRRHV
jgi:hypothetical protein